MFTCLRILACVFGVLALFSTVSQAEDSPWQGWIGLGGAPGGPGEYHTLATGQVGTRIHGYSAELVISGSVSGSDAFSEASLLVGRRLVHQSILVDAQAGPTIVGESGVVGSRKFGIVLGLHIVWPVTRFFALGFRPMVSLNEFETYGAAVVQLEFGKF